MPAVSTRPATIVWSLLAAACVVAIAFYIWLPSKQPTLPATQPTVLADEATDPPNPILATLPATPPTDPRMTPVLDALQEYLSTYKEHPVGSNAEITAALLGDNPRKLIALPRDKAALDTDGQLLDPWGKPYFFHQLSARIMELRSGGPDGRLRTDDDLQLISQD